MELGKVMELVNVTGDTPEKFVIIVELDSIKQMTVTQKKSLNA